MQQDHGGQVSVAGTRGEGRQILTGRGRGMVMPDEPVSLNTGTDGHLTLYRDCTATVLQIYGSGVHVVTGQGPVGQASAFFVAPCHVTFMIHLSSTEPD